MLFLHAIKPVTTASLLVFQGWLSHNKVAKGRLCGRCAMALIRTVHGKSASESALNVCLNVNLSLGPQCEPSPEECISQRWLDNDRDSLQGLAHYAPKRSYAPMLKDSCNYALRIAIIMLKRNVIMLKLLSRSTVRLTSIEHHRLGQSTSFMLRAKFLHWPYLLKYLKVSHENSIKSQIL